MTTVRIIVGSARVAGMGALLLGLIFWIVPINIIALHMLFGSVLALSLLILSIIMVCTRGMRPLGVIGVAYAFVLPAFGLTQAVLLVENMHWLIQVAHLLVGLGALLLIQVIYVRYKRLKQPGVEQIAPQKSATQSVR